MKKTNFIKAMMCTSILTLMFGSTVLAVNVESSKNVRGVNSYTDECEGTYGDYCSASDGIYSSTSVVNTSGYTRLFRCSVNRFNYSSMTYDLSGDGSKILDNGKTTEAEISRNKSSYIYNYEHCVSAYASTSGTSTTLVDSYKFIAKQYYD